MLETWCGKNCAICSNKEALNCPGCKEGPGKLYGCSCEIAKCCWRKGHSDCQTCQLRTGCDHYAQRYQMAGNRLSSLRAEAQVKQEADQRATLMVKWYWILFWLVIPSTIASIMNMDSFKETAPGVYLIGGVLSAVTTLTYGIVLQRMRKADEKYFNAGCCKVVVGGLNLLRVLFMDGMSFLSVTAILVSAVVAVCAVHEEYTAHSDALSGVDNDLSEKWLVLRKAYIILLSCTLGSIVLAIFAPVLGLLILLGSTIGLAVEDIVALVFLYRSGKALRHYNAYYTESV